MTITTLSAIDLILTFSAIAKARLPDLITNLTIIEPEPPAVEILENAETELDTLTTTLQDTKAILEAMLAALDTENPVSREDWENALALFGVKLEVGVGLDIEDDWDFDNGERARQAYMAVQQIINKLAGDSPDEEDFIRAILLFGDAFGGTVLRLEAGANPDDAESAASTKMVDRDAKISGAETPIIYLYITPEFGGNPVPNFVHNAANIIHEFGHVLVFRSGENLSDVYLEWQNEFWTFISAFDTYEGWIDGRDGTVFNSLANQSQRSDNLPGYVLENERIANMFQAFVLGYQPDFAGTHPDAVAGTLPSKQQRAAWAMWSFMTGVCPPTDPPDEVYIDLTHETEPCGEGLLHWVEVLAESL